MIVWNFVYFTFWFDLSLSTCLWCNVIYCFLCFTFYVWRNFSRSKSFWFYCCARWNAWISCLVKIKLKGCNPFVWYKTIKIILCSCNINLFLRTERGNLPEFLVVEPTNLNIHIFWKYYGHNGVIILLVDNVPVNNETPVVSVHAHMWPFVFVQIILIFFG